VSKATTTTLRKRTSCLKRCFNGLYTTPRWNPVRRAGCETAKPTNGRAEPLRQPSLEGMAYDALPGRRAVSASRGVEAWSSAPVAPERSFARIERKAAFAYPPTPRSMSMCWGAADANRSEGMCVVTTSSGTGNELVVRRYYEEMCNRRRNDLAGELFAPTHRLHNPQAPIPDGPEAVAQAVSVYQNAVDGRWTIHEILSVEDRVVVRWTGTGTHVRDLTGIPATGRSIRVEAISIHRIEHSKIAETWEVLDMLGLLQQLGVVPMPA
jgi:steroid delta-isomerase-like uncharacterized protein